MAHEDTAGEADRHARVHGAGTGSGGAIDPGHGHLRPRRRPVRDADRPGAVHRADAARYRAAAAAAGPRRRCGPWRRDASGLWDRTIAICLARDPKARPRSALEVGTHLSGRFARRRRAWQIAAAGLAAALIARSDGTGAELPHQPAPRGAGRWRIGLGSSSGTGPSAGFRRRDRRLPARRPSSIRNWAQPWAEMAYAYADGANTQQHRRGHGARRSARCGAQGDPAR